MNRGKFVIMLINVSESQENKYLKEVILSVQGVLMYVSPEYRM